MKIKRYTACVSHYSHGKQRSFFFKKSALEWLKKESINDYLTMTITDEWEKKTITIRDRYENYTFYMSGGCVTMERNNKPFIADNLDL